jgi:hypothetical protein
MTEMIFDTCQRLGGYVWCSVVRGLIVKRWQTIFSDFGTLRRWHRLSKKLIQVKKAKVLKIYQHKNEHTVYFLIKEPQPVDLGL